MFLLFSGAQACAGILGENIQLEVVTSGFFPSVNYVSTVLDPTPEYQFVDGEGTLRANLTDNSLILHMHNGGIFPTVTMGIPIWSFTLLSADLIFTSVTELSDSFSGGTIFNGISNGGKTISFTTATSTTSTTAEANYAFTTDRLSSYGVPVPATLILMVVGVIGLSKKARII